MKRTTKLLTMLLALVMVLSVMASCGNSTEGETTPAETTEKAPETTKKPETTKAPEATEDPNATNAPEATEDPDATKAPEATEDPDATKAPEATEDPNATKAPEATDDPNQPEVSEPDETEPDETEPDETEPDETEPEETDPVNLEDFLPEQIDLGGIDMTILAGTLYYDEWLTEDNGEIVGTELYNRVPRVENRLGINLSVEQIKGTDGALYREEVAKRQESTDPNLIADAVSGYSQYIGAMTLEGRFQNLANSDSIDFANPWWPVDLIENSVIDDKIYFVSGDISPTLLYEIYAIFFNRELVEQYNIEDPIALVNNHEWTIDKLIAITSDIYEDLDKNTAGPSKGDFYAFNINDGAHYKALPFAMGIRVIVPDEDEGYVYSDLYTGEKMDMIHDKVSDWILNNNGVHAPSEGFKDYCTGFINKTIIFNLGNFANGSHYYAGTGVDYGVVPCPMYDEEQEDYYSYYGNPTSFWAVPTNTDLDNATLLIEYLAADAYVYISPALFERALKIKYVTGEVDGLSKMFDIIRDGLLFDPCMFYNQALGSGSYNGFGSLTIDMTWSSNFTRVQIKNMARILKNDIVAKLRDLEY